MFGRKCGQTIGEHDLVTQKCITNAISRMSGYYWSAMYSKLDCTPLKTMTVHKETEHRNGSDLKRNRSEIASKKRTIVVQMCCKSRGLLCKIIYAKQWPQSERCLWPQDLFLWSIYCFTVWMEFSYPFGLPFLVSSTFPPL